MIFKAWVTSGRQSVLMGTAEKPFYFVAAYVHVTEAFNSDGTDTIIIGDDGDDDGFITSLDVSTTGVKSVTLGAFNGYNSSSRNIRIAYSNGGSEPTTGKAFVMIDVESCPLAPA